MLVWLQENLVAFVLGIMTSMLGAFIGGRFTKLFELIKGARSKYTGKWEQLIYEPGDINCTGEVKKRDIYRLRHIKLKYPGELTINIKGTIKRVYPEDQKRKWDVVGYFDGRVLTMLFQSEETQKSQGCIYVKLSKDAEFNGFYLEEHEDGVIDKTPLKIRKLEK